MLKYVLIFLLFMQGIKAQAQDAQYSQYYANALYLSPAFAGAEQNTRGIFATRYQWPGLDASFFSYTASFDHFFSEYNSGVGLILSSDNATAANFKTTQIGAMYAFQAALSKNIIFRPALQLSYVSRSIDISELTFGSQYNENGFVGGSTNESLESSRVSYADISAGGLLYSDKFWAGISVHHLNQPNQSFMDGKSPLPVKTSLFGGMKFSFTPDWKKRYINPDEEKSLSPTLLYKMQGKSDQLDIGLYGQYNVFVAGLWYRGIPVKLYKPEKINNDALIFLVGITHKGLNIGYSFDFTISKLRMATAGSHELTLSYSYKKKAKKKIQKRPVCPKF